MLGAAAAERLGIDRIYPGERIWVGEPVVLRRRHPQPAVLAPEIDTSVLIGFPAAETYLGFDGHPSEIYLRADTDQVNAVHGRARRHRQPRSTRTRSTSANPPTPSSPRPTPRAPSTACSSASARSPCSSAPSASPTSWSSRVLERRSEIGLRRALGATKGHIRIQFLAEAMLLAAARRRRRRRARRRRHRHLRPHQALGDRRPHHRLGRRPRRRHRSSAPSPDYSPPSAPPACPPPKRCGQSDHAPRAGTDEDRSPAIRATRALLAAEGRTGHESRVSNERTISVLHP